MPAYEIPLSPEAQTFSIDLNGTTYQLTFYWNSQCSSWMIDIADSLGTRILNSIPVVANTNLLQQFTYLNIKGQLIAQTDFDIKTPPTYNNLGISGHVYFITS